MARVKLRCIMGCPVLKRSYQEKVLLKVNFKMNFIHSNFHIMNTTIQLTHLKSIKQIIKGIISWLEPVKYLLDI